jgi:hypothetical protein
VNPAPGAGGGGSGSAPDVYAVSPTLFHPDPMLNAIVKSLLECRKPPEGVFASRADYLQHVMFAAPSVCEVLPNTEIRMWMSKGYLVAGPQNGAVMYLYGVSDDGGVFVNAVEGLIAGIPWASYNASGRAWRVYIVADSEIRGLLLGYDREAPGPEFTVGEEGRYRVQGDLCMGVSSGNTVWGNILDWLVFHQETLLSDAVARVLNDSGLGIDGGGGPEVVLRFAHRPDPAALARLIAPALSEMGVAEPGWWDTGRGKAVIRGAGDYSNCDLLVELSPEPAFGYSVLVRASCAKTEAGLAARMMRELRAGLKPRDFTLRIGNHTIQLENAVSGRMTYKPKAQPLLWGDRILTLGIEGTYLATPDTRATITHREHGTKTVKFNAEHAISFYTARRSPAHTAQRNTIALQQHEERPASP